LIKEKDLLDMCFGAVQHHSMKSILVPLPISVVTLA